MPHTPLKHHKFNKDLTIAQVCNDIFEGCINNNEIIL